VESFLTWKELSNGHSVPRSRQRALVSDLSGFHGGAYVVAYVEDTSECGPRPDPYCHDDCTCCTENFEPRMILEIADCYKRVNLEFDVDSEEARANSLHKLDTLITALRVFRAGVEEEFGEYERRERELKELKDE
jgi:hypothetical protein